MFSDSCCPDKFKMPVSFTKHDGIFEILRKRTHELTFLELIVRDVLGTVNPVISTHSFFKKKFQFFPFFLPSYPTNGRKLTTTRRLYACFSRDVS